MNPDKHEKLDDYDVTCKTCKYNYWLPDMPIIEENGREYWRCKNCNTKNQVQTND